MKQKTLLSILCTVCGLLAAYAAYAYVYFAWLSATPLSESQLKRVQYDAKVWLGVLVFSVVAAFILGWRRRRLTAVIAFSQKSPNQSLQPTALLGRG
jgi:hypothetical protein